MGKLSHLEPASVFKYFEEICAIPHGSGNTEKIADYCMQFAKNNNLKAIRDEANNVIIYKPASKGYENSQPVILQGHIDMVCQKTDESKVDFTKDGLEVFCEGDFVKAKDTTLGADNGIAVAMIMAILESKTLSHPPIEAVFTTDEEIGMIGANKLDISLLEGRKMINIDAEESEFLTVSCAGGSDVIITLPYEKKVSKGEKIRVIIRKLKGGHSGIEIDKGRVNANILAGRILAYARKFYDFDIISINGGDKGNAIPVGCEVELTSSDADKFCSLLNEYLKIIKKEISKREDECEIVLEREGSGEFICLDKAKRDKLIYMLQITPNGVCDMSAEIEGLVETSLNLGILSTKEEEIYMHFTLRSNKTSSLDNLEDRMFAFAKENGCKVQSSGRYLPWEYKENSNLRELYLETYGEKFGTRPKVVAIHAGLECAVFSANIKELDCIAIGPDIFDAHTVSERLSVSSTVKIFETLCELLKKSI